jgi:hypothetical protein
MVAFIPTEEGKTMDVLCLAPAHPESTAARMQIPVNNRMSREKIMATPPDDYDFKHQAFLLSRQVQNISQI